MKTIISPSKNLYDKVRKFVPYDADVITRQVDGHGRGFPHVGLEAVAKEMGYGTTHSAYGTDCVFAEREFKEWNGAPALIGWIVTVERRVVVEVAE